MLGHWVFLAGDSKKVTELEENGSGCLWQECEIIFVASILPKTGISNRCKGPSVAIELFSESSGC